MDEKRTPAQVLEAAKARISDPSRWCQGALARNKTGRKVLPYGRAAVSFCAEGAICAELGVGEWAPPVFFDYLASAAWEVAGTGPIRVNDTLDHDAVMRMYDEAIRRARETEAKS